MVPFGTFYIVIAQERLNVIDLVRTLRTKSIMHDGDTIRKAHLWSQKLKTTYHGIHRATTMKKT